MAFSLSVAKSLPCCKIIKASTMQSSSARIVSSRSSKNFSCSHNRISVYLPPLPTAYYGYRYAHALLLARLSNSTGPIAAEEVAKEKDEVDYAVMKDDPLSFWEDASSYKLSADEITEASSSSLWDSFLEAQIHLVENVARDRAAMRSILMAQRDNWNHLLQRSVTIFLMTATVLAAISGSLSTGFSVSLNLPAALLNTGTALIMFVLSHFQPSQLAEEQRAASLFFSRLANDINFTLSLSSELRPEGLSFLEDCRERLYALDAAYPMPLTPEGLDKFPKEVKSPLWNLVSTTYSSSAQQHDDGDDDDDDEWTKDLLRTAALLRSSDEPFYIGWAERMKSVNKALGIMGPLLAMAGGVLNVVGMGSGAALCSVCAGLVSTYSHDAQLGMIFEMFRNNAGYYSNIAHSIDRSISVESKSKSVGENVNAEKRKRLKREKVAYQLGRRVENENCPMIPLNEERAGTLF